MEEGHRNEFKFSLKQKDVVLAEKVFNADLYTPLTRSFIDIRDILPDIIHNLKTVLSKSDYKTKLLNGIDAFEYESNIIKSFSKEHRKDLSYNPKSVVYNTSDNKTIRSVECKLGLYINDNPIVEREFYVENFNRVARWSVDVVESVEDIVSLIEFVIRYKDINNIWDDYDLINRKGLNMAQIRELSPIVRKRLLREIQFN